MNSVELREYVYNWALGKKFTAPYGVLEGEHTNSKGKKYQSVAFGYARTLDCSVHIYNRNFITVNTSRHGTQVFKDKDSLMNFLDTL